MTNSRSRPLVTKSRIVDFDVASASNRLESTPRKGTGESLGGLNYNRDEKICLRPRRRRDYEKHNSSRLCLYTAYKSNAR